MNYKEKVKKLEKEIKRMKAGLCVVCWEEGCRSICEQDFHAAQFTIEAMKDTIKDAINILSPTETWCISQHNLFDKVQEALACLRKFYAKS